MVDTKEVTGVICLPLPALSRGRHTLSTTYIDGKYVTKNKCFEIQVVSATVNIEAGSGEDARPNETVHFVIEVTNEKGQPVKDGQIKMYYDANQTSQWAKDFVATQNTNVEIDGANIVTAGRCTIDYKVPDGFRAGILQMRFRYDLSHEGYDDKSIEVPIYIYRDGYIDLSYGYGTSSDNITPSPYKNIPEGNKCYITATLFDGSTNDANRVPVPGVPMNFKFGRLTTEVLGTIGNATTDTNGQCTVATPIIEENPEGQYKVKVKSEAKRFIGQAEFEDKIAVPRTPFVMDLDMVTNPDKSLVCAILFTTEPYFDEELQEYKYLMQVGSANGSSYDETINKFVGTDLRPIQFASCVLKLDGITISDSVRTDKYGVAEFYLTDLPVTHNKNYTLEIVVGAKYSNYEYRQSFESVRFDSVNAIFHELNFHKNGLSRITG